MHPGPVSKLPLSDEELCSLLQRQQTITFEASESAWRSLERQVERLGFGEVYLVSFAQGPRGGAIRLSPASAPGKLCDN